MGTYTCPSCFTKNEEKDLKFMCRECGNVFIEENGSLTKDGKCTNCKATTNRRRCHLCSFELPYTFGYYQDELFSVIGLKDSGKSIYIGMLIKDFGHRISEQFDVSKEIVHDNISEKYEVRYGSLKNLKKVVVTQSAEENAEIREPLIYKLLFRKKGLMGNKKLNVVTMSLFDNAGEDLKLEEKMRKANKNVFNATGIIMIIDPMQFPMIREELKSRGEPLPEESKGKIDDMLSNVTKLIRENKNLKSNQLIDIPIAIAISKSDVLMDIIGESNSMLFRESNHQDVLNKNEITGINNEVKNFIATYYDPGFVQQIEHGYRNYCFFGFSALGSNTEGKIINALRPMHVEDAFLWLLHQRNLIKMK